MPLDRLRAVLDHVDPARQPGGGRSIPLGGRWRRELADRPELLAHLEPVPGALPQAAVALVTTPRPAGWPDLWMIRRAEKAGDPWSGHMAFPGGRWEPRDADLLATAIRETAEETGIDLRDAEVLGALPSLRSPVGAPRIEVQPFVFHLPRRPDPRPNAEVASVHVFPMERLLAGEGRGTFPTTWKGHALELPCVRLDGCFIWGMSLRILDELIERLERAGPGSPP